MTRDAYQRDEDSRTADEHDDESCTCDACTRERERDESRAVAREARVRGGFDPQRRQLLGSILEPHEYAMGEAHAMTVQVHKLAQRALASSFEQLAELAEAGRYKCAGEKYASHTPDTVSRAELDALLNFAEDVITYARQQLQYMPASTFRYGERVQFVDVLHGSVCGTLGGFIKDGRWQVRVENDEVPGVGSFVAEVSEARLQRAEKVRAAKLSAVVPARAPDNDQESPEDTHELGGES